jgi:hypothetical protein
MINNSKIVPAMPWDCGQMVRKVRPEHRNAIRRLGMDPHRELRWAYDNSAEAFTWIINGQIAAIGGVVGTLASSSGRIWLALSDVAARHPLAVAREAKRQIARFLGTREELVTTLIEEDAKSIKFAYCLGFERDDSDQMAGKMGVVVMRIRRPV